MSLAEKLKEIPFSDITIEVSGTTYECHKLILWQFPFFHPLIGVDSLFDLEPLDFDIEDWETVLGYCYGKLYPEIEYRINKDRVVWCCVLADYLGRPDISQIFYKWDGIRFSLEQLAELRNISTIREAVIDAMFEHSIDLDNYPDLYHDVIRKILNGDSLLFRMSPCEERDVLHRIIDYKQGTSHLIVKLWDKVPEQYKIDVAACETTKPSKILVEYLIEHEPSRVTAEHLIGANLTYRAINLLPENDLRQQIVSRQPLPMVWKKFVSTNYPNNSEKYEMWFLYEMMRYRANEGVREYVVKHMQPYFDDGHRYYRHEGRQCIDKMRSRYRKYFS